MLHILGAYAKMIALTTLFFLPVVASVRYQDLREWCDRNHVYDSPRATAAPARVAAAGVAE
jgi:hypothetical protein